jgi:hypothetical protein
LVAGGFRFGLVSSFSGAFCTGAFVGIFSGGADGFCVEFNFCAATGFCVRVGVFVLATGTLFAVSTFCAGPDFGAVAGFWLTNVFFAGASFGLAPEAFDTVDSVDA